MVADHAIIMPSQAELHDIRKESLPGPAGKAVRVFSIHVFCLALLVALPIAARANVGSPSPEAVKPEGKSPTSLTTAPAENQVAQPDFPVRHIYQIQAVAHDNVCKPPCPPVAYDSWLERRLIDAQIIGGALMGNPEAIARLIEVWLRWSVVVDWIVWIGLALLLAPILLRMLRFVARPVVSLLFAVWLRPSSPEKSTRQSFILLADQKKAVERIRKEARRLSPDQPGRMAGLHGDWGAGKSFVVQALLSKGALLDDDDRRLAVVRINIWEDQREQDLHLSLVRTVLGYRPLYAEMASVYPWRLLFAPVLGVLGRLLPKGLEIALGGSQASLKAGVSVAMLWQQSFRYVINEAVQRGWRFVVVMDEIDRADPPLAQAAITLARRALDLPGVLVVLPYVEEQIRYKVFNPVNAVTPDLAGTLEAILDDQRLSSDEQRRWREIVDGILLPPGSKDGGKSEGGKDDKSNNDDKSQSCSLDMLRERRRVFIASLYFNRTDDNHRQREILFRRSSEKYLAWRVVLKGAEREDLVTFMLGCDTVFRELWARILGGREGEIETIIGKIAIDGIGGTLSLPAGFRIRSLRSFEGLVDEMLSKAQDDLLRETDPDIVQARIAAIFALACLFSLRG